jgi:dethiobiotin synthase
MFRGIFVTGTDTGVGKTVVCAALLHALRARIPVRYWKPIQTGIEQDDDTATVLALSGGGPEVVLDVGVRLPRPLSPHLAARLSGVTIPLEQLTVIASAQPPSDRWIVEGAGGALVPINNRDLMTDLMAALHLPVVIVARSSLGTINHTLMTVEALRWRSLPIAGVIMVGEENAENRAAIEHYGRVSVIGHLPPLTPLTAEHLRRTAADVDKTGVLEAHLR